MTQATLDSARSENPFPAYGSYSSAAIELMRAMAGVRRQTRHEFASATEVLRVLKQLGYCRKGHSQLSESDEERLFSVAVRRFQSLHNLPCPTCENVLEVAAGLGYVKKESTTDQDVSVSGSGLLIDRRRREEDGRAHAVERRQSTAPGLQESMQLTDDEHRLLDGLKDLREQTGRGFASSEEVLSLLWDLGFRPADSGDGGESQLTATERCAIQLAFTQAVEQVQNQKQPGEFLTCRELLQIAAAAGLRKRPVC